MSEQASEEKILLARPRASSERWAKLLAAHGFETVIEPLLVITPTHSPRPAGIFQSLMITSSNALDALKDFKDSVDDLLTLPCYCVGFATGEAAKSFGFKDIRCGTSDSLALAQEIVPTASQQKMPILHIAGDIVDIKAQDYLAKASIELVVWTVYLATAADDFTKETKAHFRAGDFCAIPVFSPRSARVLVSLIEKNKLTQSCHTMVAVGLSQAVGDMLQTLPWRQVCIAKTATEEGVISCLKTELPTADVKPQPSVTKAEMSQVSKPEKKRHRLLWASILALIAGGALYASGQTRLLDFLPETSPALVQSKPVDVVELAQRVHILEQRLDTKNISEPSSASQQPASIDASEISALKETVGRLQAEVSQSHDASRKLFASGLAFWDLRMEEKEGLPFERSLASLRVLTTANAPIVEEIDKMAPFATTGVSTMSQLQEMLLAEEASYAPAAESATWLGKIKTALQHLISVHPVRNPEFVPLEKAIAAGDGPGALEAFKLLTLPAQEHLEAWHEKLFSRLTVDRSIATIDTSFMTPSSQGNNP